MALFVVQDLAYNEVRSEEICKVSSYGSSQIMGYEWRDTEDFHVAFYRLTQGGMVHGFLVAVLVFSWAGEYEPGFTAQLVDLGQELHGETALGNRVLAGVLGFMRGEDPNTLYSIEFVPFRRDDFARTLGCDQCEP